RLPATETEAVAQRRTDLLAAIAGVLEREIRAGNVRPLDTGLAAEMLLGMVRTAVLFRYRSDDHTASTEHLTEEIVSLFLGGIRTTARDAKPETRPSRLASGARARAEGGAS